MPTILITGAASGLGAAFLQAYVKDQGNIIIATDRNEVGTSNPRVQFHAVDIRSQESINTLASKLKDQPIDLAIHSAGVRGLVEEIHEQKPDDVAAAETIAAMDLATLMSAFHINAAGTFMLLRALLPNLRMARDAKVVVMSSRMGSIGNNEHPKRAAGSAYAYRASKAAMNDIVRSFAADVPEVTFVLCHPGRVETNLVKSKEEGAISAEESINDMLPLIAKWSRKDSGKFYDRFGETIEW